MKRQLALASASLVAVGWLLRRWPPI